MFPDYPTISRMHIRDHTIRFTLRRWNDRGAKRWFLLSMLVFITALLLTIILLSNGSIAHTEPTGMIAIGISMALLLVVVIMLIRLFYQEQIEVDPDRVTLYRKPWPGENASLIYISGKDVMSVELSFYNPGHILDDKSENQIMENIYRNAYGGEKLPAMVTRHRTYWFFGFGTEEEKQELVILLKSELKRLGYSLSS